jgi:F-type H+-transporting ATPase subunit a
MDDLKGQFALDQYIMNHVQNAQQWHLPFLPPIHLPGFLTLHGLMLLIATGLLLILLLRPRHAESRIPSKWGNALEILVLFIRDEVAVPCLGPEDGKKLTPLFCTFFIFILFLNLMGMIPFFSTATANFNVTGALALITLCFMIFGAMYKNGIKGFSHALIPSGVPVPLLFLLVPIEFVGLFIKAFALMIRLFANMLAGHIVILALLGLIIILGYFTLPFMFVMALAIYLLEVFVAFLQAYIFTLLSAMFIGLMYHPAH